MTLTLEFNLLDGRYALAQLAFGTPCPDYTRSEFAAVISSKRGISVVCEDGAAPAAEQVQRGFRCLEIVGEYELSSVGVVAAAVQPLATAGISLFAYSTWDTDYILIQESDLQPAIRILTDAGHIMRNA